MNLLFSVVLTLAGQASDIGRAEELVRQATPLVSSDPEAAWELSRKALEASALFDPTDFAEAGRHGEVVEDSYRAARGEYRRHRARVYLTAGKAELARGRPSPALRYLRRAADLDGEVDPVPLAQALLATGAKWEALDVLLSSHEVGARLRMLATVVDELGLPSVQAEIDRVRVESHKDGFQGTWLPGPVKVPPQARLSTGSRFAFDDDATLRAVYLVDEGCATCSRDLELLRRIVPEPVQVLLAPEGDDTVLRKAIRLYRYEWPVLLGRGVVDALPAQAPAIMLVGRAGWSAVLVGDPLDRSLPTLLEMLSREDIRERLPRAGWKGVMPVRPPPRVSRPSWDGRGLAPGDDNTPPEEFARARQSFESGRHQNALSLLDVMSKDEEAWLLPPEERLNRALCLAGLGRRREARGILLAIGDSRFQDEIDQLLESVGGAEGSGR